LTVPGIYTTKVHMKNRIIQIAVILLIVALNVACDQLTKSWARSEVKGKPTREVVGTFFLLTYAENEGAFLGFGSQIPQPFRAILLSLVPAFCLVAGLLYVFLSKKMAIPEMISIACIIGGGIGNIYDRIFNNGLVTDFMNLGIGPVRTGIFNFADLSILFGVILLLLYIVIQRFFTPKTAE
jgi:signal peptidase II